MELVLCQRAQTSTSDDAGQASGKPRLLIPGHNKRLNLDDLRAPDTGLPLANPNTDMALYRFYTLKMFKKKNQ